MKFKSTKKEIMQRFKKVIKVPYCKAQNLTRFLDPIAYTSGIYGWSADIYDLGYGVALCTGYKPFGESINSDILADLEEKARVIGYSSMPYEKKIAQVAKLLEKLKGVER